MDKIYIYLNTHTYFILAFSLGLSAGFQDLYKLYKSDAFIAARDLRVIVYLVSRGIIPTILLRYLFCPQNSISQSLALAVVCFASQEATFRAKFSIKVSGAKRPISILRWYQSLLLLSGASCVAKSRKEFMAKNLPNDLDLEVLTDRIISHTGSWPDKTMRVKIYTAVTAIKDEYDSQTRSQEEMKKYKEKLGYKILELVGRKGFKFLMSP